MAPETDSVELILPRWIAPVEPAKAVLSDHALVVRAGRIEALLPAAQALERYPQARRTALPRHLLIPGLVNLHTHSAMSLLRGAADDLPLGRWLTERIWPLEGALMSDAFVYDGTVLACIEMLRGGITTFNDMYFFPEATARAALATGLRARVGIIVIDFPSAYGSGPSDYLAKGLALRDALRHEPTVGFTLAPHAPYTVSDPALEDVARLAAELQLPIHMHVHETAQEVSEHLTRHGVRPLERLRHLGLLGPELIAVHAVHLSSGEIDLLAEHGVTIAHCPHSNLKLASGLAPIARCEAAGIPIGIGTDGAASNNRLDLLLEVRTASLLAKGASGDATALDAHAALAAVTLNGARALGMEQEIGSLVPGKWADLVAAEVVETESEDLFDPVSHLIYTSGREAVTDVWIAGQSVVSERQLSDPRILAAGQAARERVGVWHNRVGKCLSGG